MSSTASTNVTQLMLDWRAGKQEALDKLMPLVYDELRRLASRYMRGERSQHRLQATALVNEAYLRMVEMKVSWQDRAHFFAVAARFTVCKYAKIALRSSSVRFRNFVSFGRAGRCGQAQNRAR